MKRPLPVGVDEFVSRWNDWVAKHPKMSKVQKLTAERRKKLLTRLQEPEWWETFLSAIKLLPLPCAENQTWQPSFDWLIRNEAHVYRITEGEFSWRGEGDPAMAKVRQQRLKQEAAARETRLHRAKMQQAKDSAQARRAIDGILKAKPGAAADGYEQAELFGPEGDSSANGAGS